MVTARARALARALAVAVAIVAVPRAAAADDLESADPRASTWLSAEVDTAFYRPSTIQWFAIGPGLELRQRLVAGLRVGVRAAALELQGGDPVTMDRSYGLALHTAASIDYEITVHRWGSLAVMLAPEVGVAITALRGTGADDGAIRSVFYGPRLGFAMGRRRRLAAPAIMAARTWGAHFAFGVVESRYQTEWQLMIGYDWGR